MKDKQAVGANGPIKELLGDIDYLINLDWVDLQTDKKASNQILEMTKAAKTRLGLKRGSKKEGFQVALANKESSGVVAGAGLLADLYSDILLVEKISGNQYWVVMVTGGKILTTTDIVVPVSEIDEAMEQMMEIVRNVAAESDFIMVMPEEERFAEYGDSNHNLFGDLVADATKKDISNNKVKSLVAPINPMLLLGIISTFGGGYYYYEEVYLKNPMNNLALLQAMLGEDEEAKKRAQEDEARRKAYAEDVEYLQGSLLSMNWNATKEIINEIVNDYPSTYEGWSRTKLELTFIEAGGQLVIDSEWIRDSSGTVLSIKPIDKVIKNSTVTVDNTKRNKATVSSIRKISPLTVKIKDLNGYLANQNDKVNSIIADFQLSKEWIWKFNNKGIPSRFKPIQGLSGSERTQYQFAFSQHELNVSGKGFASLVDLIEFMQRYQGFKFNSMEIINDQNHIRWKLNGDYYAK